MGSPAQRLPRARSAKDFVFQELGDELLVYDRRTHHAHSLHRQAAVAFRRCDGHTTFAQVSGELAALGLPSERDHVEAALEELRIAGLLEVVAPVATNVALSRRDALRRVGFIAGAAVAIPLVQSIVAPSVAQAASCGGPNQTCCGGTTCDPGLSCLGGSCQGN